MSTPTTPVKYNSGYRDLIVISPYKSPKRSLGFQRLVSSPMKSPSFSLKKLSLNSPQRCPSPSKSRLNSQQECGSPAKSNLNIRCPKESPAKLNANFPQDCRSPVKSGLPCPHINHSSERLKVSQDAGSSVSEKENSPRKKSVSTPGRKMVSMLKLQRVNSKFNRVNPYGNIFLPLLKKKL